VGGVRDSTTRAQERREWETYAALILRRLDGGWPWLFTKRICLGGGRAPWIGVVMSAAPHSKTMVSRCAALGRTRCGESLMAGGLPALG
jgi:hypothetical protein